MLDLCYWCRRQTHLKRAVEACQEQMTTVVCLTSPLNVL
jgi:hypothetical protein